MKNTVTNRMLIMRIIALVALLLTYSFAEENNWESIFDGKTLTGWSAPDMSYFSVADGAITGETTSEHNPPRNQFIVWQGGQVDNFDVRFEFRIFGPASNSGMQFRSEVKEFGLVHGYQADIDGKGRVFGGIWDEYGTRRSLSARGKHTIITADGSRTVTPIDGAAALDGLDLTQWTRYEISAHGPRIELRINGITSSILEDHETGKAASSGVLAMPIVPGEPMRVQYRAIELRRANK